MSKRLGLMTALGLAAVLVLTGCFGLWGAKKDKKEEAGPTAQQIFEEKCTFCHALNTVLEQRHTRAGWAAIVERCSDRKKWHVSSSKRKIITDYLFEIRPADKEPPAKPGKDKWFEEKWNMKEGK